MSVMLLWAAAAAAATPDLRADYECMTLYLIGAATAQKEAEKTAAIAGTMYFYGRIDHAAPGTDMAAQLKSTGTSFESMDEMALNVIGGRCDAIIQSVGQRLQSAGKTIDGK